MESPKGNRNRLGEAFDRHLEELRGQAEKSGVPLVNVLMSIVEPRLKRRGMSADNFEWSSEEALVEEYREAFLARHANVSFSKAMENQEQRQTGGRRTGEAKTRQGEATKRRVLAEAARLESEGKGGRGLAKRLEYRISQRPSASGERPVGVEQIRKILRAERKKTGIS